MKQWLTGDYRAVLFEDADSVMGYALFRHEAEFGFRDYYITMEHQPRNASQRE